MTDTTIPIGAIDTLVYALLGHHHGGYTTSRDEVDQAIREVTKWRGWPDDKADPPAVLELSIMQWVSDGRYLRLGGSNSTEFFSTVSVHSEGELIDRVYDARAQFLSPGAKSGNPASTRENGLHGV